MCSVVLQDVRFESLDVRFKTYVVGIDEKVMTLVELSIILFQADLIGTFLYRFISLQIHFCFQLLKSKWILHAVLKVYKAWAYLVVFKAWPIGECCV